MSNVNVPLAETSAFPSAVQSQVGSRVDYHMGLSKREYFAGRVLQSLAALRGQENEPYYTPDDAAYDAVLFADALIKALEEKATP